MNNAKTSDGDIILLEKKTNMDLSKDILSSITVFGKYAKYLPKLERRETWEEITTRNMDMHIKKYPMLEAEIRKNYKYVYGKKILPSMRSMQFAGKPIEIAPNRLYNCCYLPIDDHRAFSETMFLLLGGTGVGYSVQKHHVEKLPEVQKPSKTRRYLVADSIEGWADAVKALMKSYFGKGVRPLFDFTDIRAKGARLVTSGGKAPGPEPLKECLEFIENILLRKENGSKLSPLECHDILCHIANAVLSGGIRRAAMICGFNLDDTEMINCKSSAIKVDELISTEYKKIKTKNGLEDDSNTMILTFKQEGILYRDIEIRRDEKHGVFFDMEQYNTSGTFGWWVANEQRGRSNNSAVIMRHKITKKEFIKLWKRIEASGSGEPGIYLSNDKDWFTNPCCEIALRPFQFCNLCEINASDIVSQEDYNERARIAAFIGTLQAGYTDFHYLREIWKKTTEKDGLLGVGMTGIADGSVLGFDMSEAAQIVINENERVANIIGINKAARTTCVKPSGTSSCVLGTASGIHARHAAYYKRRQRLGKNEALYTYLAINHPELLEDDMLKPGQAIVTIPQKSPKGSIFRTESAIDLLERVKKVSAEWVKLGHINGNNTHNVSATISIRKEYDKSGAIIVDEWPIVGEWMWNNKEFYNGLSVLPHSNHSYIQAPFEEITEEEYNLLYENLKKVDLSNVIETDDATNQSGEAACQGGQCELT
jgi:hypothetical protein